MSYDDLGNRLKIARKNASFSQLELANKLEITDKTLRRYENGENITVEIVQKISDICDEDFNYLINGDSQADLATKKESKSKYNDHITLSKKDKELAQVVDLIAVNVYNDVYASAGFGNTLTESVAHKTYFDKHFLNEVFNVMNFEALDMIKVIGDSMSPTIKDGELIVIERGSQPKNGDTIIATIHDELYVKKLYKDPFSEVIKLKSENKEYDTIELNTPEKLDALNIIGIVRTKIKVF